MYIQYKSEEWKEKKKNCIYHCRNLINYLVKIQWKITTHWEMFTISTFDKAEQRVLFNGEQEQLFWDRLKVAKWVNCWLESEDWSSFCLRIISSYTLCKVKFVDLFARSRLNDFSHRALTTGAVQQQ